MNARRLIAIAILGAGLSAGCGSSKKGGAGAASTAAPVASNQTAPTTSGTAPTTSGSNTAPVITSTPPAAAPVGVAYDYTPAAQDADGDPLAFSLISGPTGLTAEAGTGRVRWTPVLSQVGQHAVELEVSDGTVAVTQSWTIDVTQGSPLPTNATLTDLGAPQGGLPVISDLVEFDGRLWLCQSLDPLNQFGAQLWTWQPGAGFTRVLNDPTSQGFLRGKVFGGKLYVPDSDPNGLAPGVVYVFDNAAAAPTRTVVEEAVHNFDVVEFGGELYVSGGLDTGESSLNRWDAGTGRWVVASRGAFSRLKYMAVAGGQIWSSKRSTGTTTADLVQIGANLQQQGASALQGESLTVAAEAVGPAVYLTISGQQGVAHIRVDANGATAGLTGITGALLFDYTLHSDGNVYAVGTDFQGASFLYGSTDGLAFTRLVDVPDLRFGRVGANADGRPSITSFQGKLYCGSSTNGKLYRVD